MPEIFSNKIAVKKKNKNFNEIEKSTPEGSVK